MAAGVGENLTMAFTLVILVAVIAGLLSWLFVLTPSDSQFVGSCLVGIGIVHILLHRVAGRRALNQGRKMPFASNLWDHIGARGSELIYLGIGISCAVVGVMFLVKSALVK